MDPKTLERRLPAILFAGWVVPGASHWAIGHRRRGAFLFVAILATFVVGFAMGGYRTVSLERHPIAFAAHACMGATCGAGAILSARLPTPHLPPKHQALGILYSAVASLLNMLCVLDAYERVARMNLPPKEAAA